ncbi:MAG TPA: hypothetical protein DCW31_02495 [Lactobacillus sp.]|nr:hypothetical protein [Lactobacillus sp.]
MFKAKNKTPAHSLNKLCYVVSFKYDALADEPVIVSPAEDVAITWALKEGYLPSEWRKQNLSLNWSDLRHNKNYRKLRDDLTAGLSLDFYPAHKVISGRNLTVIRPSGIAIDPALYTLNPESGH